jgi:arsenate reductase
MKLKVYEYKNCDSCRKALKYLDSRKIAYEKIPIVDSPPSVAELKKMSNLLQRRGGSFKQLFNTSGELYRKLKISERLKAGLSEDEALALLAKEGKLIKRPFVLSEKAGTVGFRPEIWEEIF